MSEEKGTYGCGREMNAAELKEHVKSQIAKRSSGHVGGPWDSNAQIAFGLLELADAIRNFPRLWIEAVAGRSADGTFTASRKPGGIADP